MIARRAQGPRGPQGPRAPHRASPSSSASRWSAARSSSPTRCRSRSTASSPTSYDEHRRRHHRQGGRQGLHQRQRRHHPCSRCSTKVRALPEVDAAGGERRPRRGQRRRRHRPRRQGGRRQRERRRQLSTPPTPQFSPLKLKSGAGRTAPAQVVIDAGTADKEHYTLGDSVVVVDARRRSTPTRSPASPSFGDVDSLGFASIAAWDMQDRADAAAPRGPLRRRSRSPRSTGTSPAELVQRRQAARAAPACRSRTAPGAGGGGRRRTSTRACATIQLLPARLRRHRAARRRVRDLQHAVDHGRPAHARVRHAAHARRLAQAGHALRECSRAS